MKPYTVDSALSLLRGEPVNLIDQEEYIITDHHGNEFPAPPEGHQWAGEDLWVKSKSTISVSVGFRPMLIGELPEPGDDHAAYGHLPFVVLGRPRKGDWPALTRLSFPHRTKRPLDLSKIMG